MTTLATETWPGAANAALPAQWTSTLATGGSATQSGAGYATLNPGTSGSFLNTWSYLSGMTATVDTDVAGWISHATLTESYQYVAVRATTSAGSAAPYYTATGYTVLFYAVGGAGNLQVTVAKAGTEFSTGGGASQTKTGFATVNGQINYRIRVTGTTTTRIQVRTWTGGTEPSTWDFDFNDTASPQTAAGKVRLGSTNNPGRFGPLTVTDAAAGSAAATATGSVTLAGTATGAAAAAGSGTATGSITLGGTATPRAATTATGGITLAGTATGTGAGTPPAVPARFLIWDGSAWQLVAARVWDGFTWRSDIPITVTP